MVDTLLSAFADYLTKWLSCFSIRCHPKLRIIGILLSLINSVRRSFDV